MMGDLISRQMAIDALFGLYEYQRDIDPTEAADLVRQGIYLAEKKIEQLPSAQSEPKRGQWEMLQMPISPPVYKCSVCGSHALQSMTGCLMNRHYEANLTNFCPHCGAKMEVSDGSD